MAKPASVDDYLAALPKDSRAAMERLRKTIKGAAPQATEAISYQMAAFKDRGHSLVTYAAFKDHCSLFPMSKAVIAAHKKELKPFISGQGTLRFTPAEPIPAPVIRKIVKARLAENLIRWPK